MNVLLKVFGFVCTSFFFAREVVAANGAISSDPNTWYVILLGISALGFLLLRVKWGRFVPDIFFWIHFTIVCWSALMYMNIVFQTPLASFAYYADWILSTPLIMLSIALTAMYPFKEINWSSIFGVIVTQVMVIMSGILAQLAPSEIGKIAYFLVGNLFMLLIFYFIFGPFMRIARKNVVMMKKYKILAYFFTGFWLLYPLVWVIGAPGYQLISSYLTSLLFVLLPIFCKPIFGFIDLYLIYKARKQM